MIDETTPQDGKAMSPASDGSHDDPLSVCCRHLANSQKIIERKNFEIERRRLTREEREAIEVAAGDYLYHQDPGGRAKWIRETLQRLLERLG